MFLLVQMNFKKTLTTNIFFNHCFDKRRFSGFLQWYFKQSCNRYIKLLRLLDRIKFLGFNSATQAGFSISIDDLKIPLTKSSILWNAENLVFDSDFQLISGNLTTVERYQRILEIWNRTSEKLKSRVLQSFQISDFFNPVYLMAFSGARGNISQIRQLVGMRGLMADPQGRIIDFPIRSNFREGLTLTEYLISCSGARKGIVDTALRTAASGYLTRRLVDVAHQVIICQIDCNSFNGIYLTDLFDQHKKLLFLKQRLIGRVLAETIYSPKTSAILVPRNQEISKKTSKIICENKNKVFIRSPLTCQSSKFICQLCYGWSLAEGQLVSIGEAVGVIAAQSIGEPGTQLTMRTFHTGGVFSGKLMDQTYAPFPGEVNYTPSCCGRLIRTQQGHIAYLSKNNGILRINSDRKNSVFKDKNNKLLYNQVQNLNRQLNIFDEKNHHRSQQIKFIFQSGTLLYVREGEIVTQTQLLAELPAFKPEATFEIEQEIFSSDSGEIYFENFLFLEKTMTDLKSQNFTQKLGSFWILSGKLFSSTSFEKQFFSPLDLIDQSVPVSQIKLTNQYFDDFLQKPKSFLLYTYKKNFLILSLFFRKRGYFVQLSSFQNYRILSFGLLGNFKYSSPLSSLKKLYLNTTLEWNFKIISKKYFLRIQPRNNLNLFCTLKRFSKNNNFLENFYLLRTSRQGYSSIFVHQFFFNQQQNQNFLNKKVISIKKLPGIKNLNKNVFQKTSKIQYFNTLQFISLRAPKLKNLDKFKVLQTLFYSQIKLVFWNLIFKQVRLFNTQSKNSFRNNQIFKFQILHWKFFYLQRKYLTQCFFLMYLLTNFNKKTNLYSKFKFKQLGNKSTIRMCIHLPLISSFSYPINFLKNYYFLKTKRTPFTHKRLFKSILTRNSFTPFYRILPKQLNSEGFLRNYSSFIIEGFQKYKWKKKFWDFSSLSPYFYKSVKNLENTNFLKVLDHESWIFLGDHQLFLNQKQSSYKNCFQIQAHGQDDFSDQFPIPPIIPKYSFQLQLNIIRIQNGIFNCIICYDRLRKNVVDFYFSSYLTIVQKFYFVKNFNLRFNIQKPEKPVWSRFVYKKNTQNLLRIKKQNITKKYVQKRKIQFRKYLIRCFRSQIYQNNIQNSISKSLSSVKDHNLFIEKSRKFLKLKKFNFRFFYTLNLINKKKFKSNIQLLKQQRIFFIKIGPLLFNKEEKLQNICKNTFFQKIYLPEVKFLPIVGHKNIINFQFMERKNSKFFENRIFIRFYLMIKCHEIINSLLSYLLINSTDYFACTNFQLNTIYQKIRLQKKFCLNDFDRFKGKLLKIQTQKSLGVFFKNGEKFNNQIFPNGGQLVAKTSKKLLFRRAKIYLLNKQSILYIKNGESVMENQHLFSVFYSQPKTGDIVQGIPQIEEIFEARKKSKYSFHELPIFTKDFCFFEKKITLYLRSLQKSILNNIQRIYCGQGIYISDKHIEIIVRQLTSNVLILEPGQTGLLGGEIVTFQWISRVNQQLSSHHIIYEPILLGMTKTCLETSSFLSAASFQETTRILGRAALQNQVDFIRGLKQNVILGNLIPVGTGCF
uniref:DNA-directed RNA polymerase n=1 Tax=Tydemania expeditionis TaxID=325645 RepID=A0A0D6E1Z3_TYDEX|nr:RNA polymerase beta' subunit [Tydemania expeditionis]CEO91058.1 RNA polymerase beta' subunit [Tydemania expeditionis]